MKVKDKNHESALITSKIWSRLAGELSTVIVTESLPCFARTSKIGGFSKYSSLLNSRAKSVAFSRTSLKSSGVTETAMVSKGLANFQCGVS